MSAFSHQAGSRVSCSPFRRVLFRAGLLLLLAIPVQGDEDPARQERRRRPRSITYDRQVDLSGNPFAEARRMHDELTKPRDPLAELEAAEGLSMSIMPYTTAMDGLGQQPRVAPGPRRQQEKDDSGSDNWLTGSADIGTILGVRDAESGWGWLADSVREVRQNADMEASPDMQESSEGELAELASRSASPSGTARSSPSHSTSGGDLQPIVAEDASFVPLTQTRRESATHPDTASRHTITETLSNPNRDDASDVMPAPGGNRVLRDWESDMGIGERGSATRRDTIGQGGSRGGPDFSASIGRGLSSRQPGAASISGADSLATGRGFDPLAGQQSVLAPSAYGSAPLDTGRSDFSPWSAGPSSVTPSYQAPSYQSRSYHGPSSGGGHSWAGGGMAEQEYGGVQSRRDMLRSARDEGSTLPSSRGRSSSSWSR